MRTWGLNYCVPYCIVANDRRFRRVDTSVGVCVRQDAVKKKKVSPRIPRTRMEFQYWRNETGWYSRTGTRMIACGIHKSSALLRLQPETCGTMKRGQTGVRLHL